MSFPMSGLGTTSLLALDALLVVIDTIEENCVCRRANLTTASSPYGYAISNGVFPETNYLLNYLR